MTKGGRNLLILGFGAIAVAVVTTSVSLIVYHNSGDIYLDRSRPGFLPEESEVEEEKTTDDYKFSDSGTIDSKTLQEYLDELKTVVKTLDEYQDPYSASPLSNSSLGIPEE